MKNISWILYELGGPKVGSVYQRKRRQLSRLQRPMVVFTLAEGEQFLCFMLRLFFLQTFVGRWCDYDYVPHINTFIANFAWYIYILLLIRCKTLNMQNSDTKVCCMFRSSEQVGLIWWVKFFNVFFQVPKKEWGGGVIQMVVLVQPEPERVLS